MPKVSFNKYLEDTEGFLDEATDWTFLNKKYPSEEGETFPTEKARRLDYMHARESGRWDEIRKRHKSCMESRLDKRALKCEGFLNKYRQHRNPQSVADSEVLERVKEREALLVKLSKDGGLLNELTILNNDEERAGHHLLKRRAELKRELRASVQK